MKDKQDLDERIHDIAHSHSLGYWWHDPDENSFMQVNAEALAALLSRDIKQLISDAVDAVMPKQLTEADELDFTLHDNDPVGNTYFAYNCAVAEMKVRKQGLGL